MFNEPGPRNSVPNFTPLCCTGISQSNRDWYIFYWLSSPAWGLIITIAGYSDIRLYTGGHGADRVIINLSSLFNTTWWRFVTKSERSRESSRSLRYSLSPPVAPSVQRLKKKIKRNSKYLLIYVLILLKNFFWFFFTPLYVNLLKKIV